MATESSLDQLLKQRGQAASENAPLVSVIDDGSKPAILIVDDELGMRQALKSIFSTSYNVILAADGKEALELFNQHKNIACVVTDAMMPNMDGFQTASFLHSMNVDIPIIMLTAHQAMHEPSKVVDFNFKGYVTKGDIRIDADGRMTLPSIDDLMKRVKSACDEYAQVVRKKYFEHASDPELIQQFMLFSMDVAAKERVLEDHSIAGAEEASRYISGTSYPENSDYILFAKELDHVFNLQGKEVIEFCTGPGDLSKRISEYGVNRVVALDGSESMINYASRKHRQNNLEYRLVDLFKLDGACAGADLVVCQNSMHHFEGDILFHFFEAGLKCLKPGGSVYVSDYRHESIDDSILAERLKATNKHVRDDLMHTIEASLTKAYLESVLNRFGDQITYRVFFPDDIFNHLKRQPDYIGIVSKDPHPHNIDYKLSLRVHLTKVR